MKPRKQTKSKGAGSSRTSENGTHPKRGRLSRPQEFALNFRCLMTDIVKGPEAWRKLSFHYAGLRRSVRLK